MRRALLALFVLPIFALSAGLTLGGSAAASGQFQAGFGAFTITPVGEPPDGWPEGWSTDDFWKQPVTGVWSEEFIDRNDNNCWDPGEPHIDDYRNSLIDPQSTGKWDGINTNAGFSGRCALGFFDHTWARAVVMRDGAGTTVAMVSVDVVGWFNEEIIRGEEELAAMRPDIELDGYVVAATHTHEGPDTMGLWGRPGYASDGKFPLYQAFIRARINQAIAEAYDSLEDADVTFAQGTQTTGIRDSRSPIVIDPNVWTARFARPDETTIGTLVNWSNHPEALGSGNQSISSDFAHPIREHMEAEYGGISIFFSGSVGGLMTPLGTEIPGYGTSSSSYPRMMEIGRLVAVAAVEALEDPARSTTVADPAIDVAHKEFFLPVDNHSLRALNAAGLFDKPGYVAGLPTNAPVGEEILTEMYAVKVGPGVFITVPGELFPEIALGGYGRPDCPQADTGRPYEPVIHDQFEHDYKFILGLGQDELGYIVPGYDFHIFGVPPGSGGGTPFLPVGVNQASTCGSGHYEETVSASSVMAPVVACTAAELAGKDPWNDPDNYPACTPENTSVAPGGTHPRALGIPYP